MQFIVDKYLKGDKVIWAIIILLSLFSIIMAYSSSSNLAYRLMDGNATPYLIKHTFVIVIGILLIIYLQFFNYKYFSIRIRKKVTNGRVFYCGRSIVR